MFVLYVDIWPECLAKLLPVLTSNSVIGGRERVAITIFYVFVT